MLDTDWSFKLLGQLCFVPLSYLWSPAQTLREEKQLTWKRKTRSLPTVKLNIQIKTFLDNFGHNETYFHIAIMPWHRKFVFNTKNSSSLRLCFDKHLILRSLYLDFGEKEWTQRNLDVWGNGWLKLRLSNCWIRQKLLCQYITTPLAESNLIWSSQSIPYRIF